MSNKNDKAVAFALTRGYAGLEKLHYIRLLLRNRALRRLFGRGQMDFLLFHEGNISQIDQKFLTALSGIPLRFIDIADVFRLGPTDVWTGTSEFGLGYSLMCRFNYQYVWDYLAEYDVAYRVDEDVVVISLPDTDFRSEMLVGCVFSETHDRTNSTLPTKLSSMGAGDLYNHKFPYTNCYVTKVGFWLRPDVQEFIHRIGEDPMAIENRWGDAPVIGVTLQALGFWDPEASTDNRIQYVHGSHRASVLDGRLREGDSPARHKDLGWIALALASLEAAGSRIRAVKRSIQAQRSLFNGRIRRNKQV